MSLPVYFAPLQGYTDVVYRKAHAALFGGIAAYYTPFVRIEKGDFRRKDLRDIDFENNRGVPAVPQAIASEADELRRIVDCMASLGYTRVDINLGCPFPILAYRHKGSGILPFPDEVERLLRPLESYDSLEFSVKMRLGWEEPSEALRLLPLLESLPLRQITLHARLGKQQYKGCVDMESFGRFYDACPIPLVYNGDLTTVEEMVAVEREFPRLSGLMVGRGLLAKPWLAEEYGNENFSSENSYRRVASLHERVFTDYKTLLQGEHQLLTRMMSFWEYLLPDMEKRLRKRLSKSRNVKDYTEAVNLLFSSLEGKN